MCKMCLAKDKSMRTNAALQQIVHEVSRTLEMLMSDINSVIRKVI